MVNATFTTSVGDQNHASYWLGNNRIEQNRELTSYQLSAYRRSIAHFVTILTERNDIPITYRLQGRSYTDGKSITISSDISDECFDSVVGLALHEAAHVVKSDFHIVQNLAKFIPKKIFKLAKSKKLNDLETTKYVKKMFNWIEDRYIDAWVCTHAPGYSGYYDSLYNRYFNSKRITEALKDNELFTSLKLSSYSFRIINLTNPESVLTALPGLKKIHTIADLKNILSLTTTEKRLDIAIAISEIVFKNINSLEIKNSPKQEKSDSDGENRQSGDTTQSNEEGEVDSGDPDSVDENAPPQESEFSDSDDEETSDQRGDSKEETVEPDDASAEEKSTDNDKADDKASSDKKKPKTSSEKSEDDIKDDVNKGENISSSDKADEIASKEKKIEDDIKKQEVFMAGEIEKKNIESTMENEINLIENHGVFLVEVGDPNSFRVKCIVVKKLTKELVESAYFPFKTSKNSENEKAIVDGIRLGTALGRKLQVRGETNTLKFIRQNNGRIERRLIHELGFDNGSVFEKTLIEKFKKAELHISLDLSSSMSGVKWKKTLTCVTAICKAASMIPNLKVVVSMRSTQSLGNPYILIAYDSKVDKFAKIPTLFKDISPNGGTPEGLTFEAILDLIPESNHVLDSYFVNLSDGEPCFGLGGKSYSGEPAWQHTKQQVNKILKKNVKVLSYFIDSNDSNEMNATSLLLALAKNKRSSSTLYSVGMGANREAFSIMYGKNANFINVTSIMEIARTLNKKFLEK